MFPSESTTFLLTFYPPDATLISPECGETPIMKVYSKTSMDFLPILLIAIGLAMDAFAVSITSGLTIQKCHPRHIFRIAFFFGAFQGIMPILGWLTGSGFRDHISHIDHWIAFFLLSGIGIKMIHESRQEDLDCKMDPLNLHVLLGLSVATSIDAFGVGLSLSILNSGIMIPALIIAVVTFILSSIGVYIGDTFGHVFERKIEMIGGIVLIIIGLQILLDHLFF